MMSDMRRIWTFLTMTSLLSCDFPRGVIVTSRVEARIEDACLVDAAARAFGEESLRSQTGKGKFGVLVPLSATEKIAVNITNSANGESTVEAFAFSFQKQPDSVLE